MKLEMHVCNTCGRKVEDIYEQIGWINIDGERLIVTNGRDSNGYVKIARYTNKLVYNIIFNRNNSLDFCSLSCFLIWLFLSKDTRHNKSNENDEFLVAKEVEFFEKLIKKMIEEDDFRYICNYTRKLNYVENEKYYKRLVQDAS